MAKHHQYLTPYQQRIVRNHFAHRDAAALQKLAEIVSDLYLATGEKEKDRLWKSAATWLGKAGAEEKRAQPILAARDVTALAALVGELSAPQSASAPPSRRPGASAAPRGRKPAGDDL